MTMDIRRVVTGHDENGKAVVILDGAPPINNRAETGNAMALIWSTLGAPADNRGNEDGGAHVVPIAPTDGGSTIRIVEYPPESTDGPARDERAHLESLGGHVPETPARHPGMHKTDSVDYALILAGEIDMLLDDDDVHLTAGDVVVQRGTYHAWANRGAVPCRIAFILIGADPLP
jgi:mannose-6-phosphate isomerase-like protein (cupin superfamily)